MKPKRAGGFTLLELLIVVIVVGVLAAVILPQFTSMANRPRSTEAVNAVGALLTAEWVYYQQHNRFSGVLTELLVNVAQDNYAYHNSKVDLTETVWVGLGVAGTPHAGIRVQGTITNTGHRTIVEPAISSLE